MRAVQLIVLRCPVRPREVAPGFGNAAASDRQSLPCRPIATEYPQKRRQIRTVPRKRQLSGSRFK